MAVALALVAAVAYGAADFFGGLASRRVATLAVAVWSQGAGLVLLALMLPFFPGAPRAADVGWGLACGAFGAVAIALLYRGLATGTMGVVSPLTAVLAAAIPVAFGAARGQSPTPPALAGIAAALVSIVLISAAPPKPGERRPGGLPPGVPEALGSGIGFGVYFIGLAQPPQTAGFFPLLAARVVSFGVLGAAGLIAGRAALSARGDTLRTIVLAGVLDMAANVLYVVAAHSGLLAVVAVLTSLYPGATIVLAALLLGERLGRIQWLGVAVALAGIAAIAAAP